MNIVGEFGENSVLNWGDLVILYHLKAKLSIRRDGTARGPVPEVAPGSIGGSGKKGIFPGTSDSRQQQRDLGSEQSRAEVVLC